MTHLAAPVHAPKRFQIFLNTFFYRSLCLLERLIAVFPPPAVKFCMKGLFRSVFPFMGKIKKICIKNLRSVYGEAKSDKEYDTMANTIIGTIGYGMFDLIYLLDHADEMVRRGVIHNEEYLRQALKQGHGVIAVSAHMGNFPVLFLLLAQRGFKINVVIRPMRDQNFSKFMHDLCAKGNINMIQTLPKKQFYKDCVRVLQRNELLFFLLDEFVPDDKGVRVKFFDKMVMRSPGPMLFRERIGSPVVPIFVAQDSDQKFHVYIEPALKVHADKGRDENDTRNVADLTEVIESFVRRFPLQWGGWLNKKWAELS